MNQYAFLLGYYDKQLSLVKKLYQEIANIDLSVYEKRYLFALKTQQFYTALEDLFKQIAKAFENHIESSETFHKELLVRMNTDVPKMRPKVLSTQAMLFLDKLRAFRHFIRHAYDCELDTHELQIIEDKLKSDFKFVEHDLQQFRQYLEELTS